MENNEDVLDANTVLHNLDAGAENDAQDSLDKKLEELDKNGYVQIDAEYKHLIAVARSLKRQIGELDQQLEEVKEAIKEKLGDGKGVYNSYGETLVTYGKVTRKTFDSKNFKKDHADLYLTYLIENTSERLTIK